MIRELLDAPAPAKLNLFLHVTGRRPDGYHTIETVFQLIDLCDRISFRLRDDGDVRRPLGPAGVAADDDLCVRAARLLQRAAGVRAGVDIALDKQIPIGGGLGGGSSDAATTLLACNRLWEAGCTREQLAQLALQLGADVPFFVFGRNAYATGIGEALQPLQLPAQSFVVVAPPATVATRDIFADPDLTRETKPFKIDGLWRGRLGIYSGRNDLEPVVVRRFPAVAAALAALKESAVAAGMDPALVRMSGSGACVFAPAPSASLAERIAMDVLRCQVGTVRVADGLFEHPLGSRQVG